MSEKKELKKRLAEIEEKESQEKIDKAYTEFKKLIGKCFRRKNSYGGSDKWWLYQKVISIERTDLYLDFSGEVSSAHCQVIFFQTDTSGSITVCTEETLVRSLGEEISESKFNKEFDKLLYFFEELRG